MTVILRKFKRYTYSNPELLPVQELSQEVDFEDVITKTDYFSTEDEEVGLGELSEDWNGHKAGAIVISGLTTPGSVFFVEIN